MFSDATSLSGDIAEKVDSNATFISGDIAEKVFSNTMSLSVDIAEKVKGKQNTHIDNATSPAGDIAKKISLSSSIYPQTNPPQSSLAPSHKFSYCCLQNIF